MSQHSDSLGVDVAVDRVRPLVRERLRVVEQERDLRVVFACESGSRAWGFASEDSDYDVRFIYVRPAEAYLRLRPPVDAFDQQDDNDLDLAGWDIRKTAELMRKSNSALFEWLGSPIIYEQDDEISSRLVELRNLYFDPKKSVYHYLSLAGGIWSKYIAGNPAPVRKKYLYAIRPLACIRFIEKHMCQPPTLFESVLNGIEVGGEVRGAIDRLVDDKKQNRELGSGVVDSVLNAWIKSEVEHGERLGESLSPVDITYKELDGLIADSVLGRRGVIGDLV